MNKELDCIWLIDWLSDEWIEPSNRRGVFALDESVWRMCDETSAISDSTKSYSHATIQQMRIYFPEPSTIISADLSEIKSTNTKRTRPIKYKSVNS